MVKRKVERVVEQTVSPMVERQRNRRVEQNEKNLIKSMTVKKFEPLTDRQEEFFREFNNFDVISLVGSAGTGKTFQALYKALLAVESKSTPYYKVYIVRSSVSGRDIGFLKGNAQEKMQAFESPYVQNVNKLYGRDDAYEIMSKKGVIEFHPTSFLRGVTMENSIVIVDEAQNCSYQELYTILTRVGENCKVIITGDTAQDDLTSKRYNEESGYPEIKKILDGVDSCLEIEYSVEDIVRSGFVKEFIISAQRVAEDKKSRVKTDKHNFDEDKLRDIFDRVRDRTPVADPIGNWPQNPFDGIRPVPMPTYPTAPNFPKFTPWHITSENKD